MEAKKKNPPMPVGSKGEARKREYLVLNYPADIRKNLKSLSSFSFENDGDGGALVQPKVVDLSSAATGKTNKNQSSTAAARQAASVTVANMPGHQEMQQPQLKKSQPPKKKESLGKGSQLTRP